MTKDASFWIQKLKLLPHPEGGYYAETYKSNNYKSSSTNKKNTEKTTWASLIYFLLSETNYSAFHKLKSDEIWMYHEGSAAYIYIIHPKGHLTIEKFGSDIENGEKLQVLIPANTWFSSELVDKTSFCLMSCMVTPGFSWDDFELGKKNQLCNLYPEHKDLIKRLCRE